MFNGAKVTGTAQRCRVYCTILSEHVSREWAAQFFALCSTIFHWISLSAPLPLIGSLLRARLLALHWSAQRLFRSSSLFTLRAYVSALLLVHANSGRGIWRQVTVLLVSLIWIVVSYQDDTQLTSLFFIVLDIMFAEKANFHSRRKIRVNSCNDIKRKYKVLRLFYANSRSKS